MKIIHLSFSDYGKAGGTSIALWRLHRALLGRGTDSKILCKVRTVEDGTSIALTRHPLVRLAEGLGKQFWSRAGLNDLHVVSSGRIRFHPAYREADVLHLHSIHSSYFNFLALPGLTAHKPSVWTVHDFWALTGHCTFSYDCRRWQTGCGRCPYPKNYPPIRRDATALEWRLKRKAYRGSQMRLVTASRWLASCMKQSILSHLPVDVIPWGLDLGVFRPPDRGAARAALGLPAGKRVLMAAAVQLQYPNKGSDTLLAALRALPESLRREMVVMTMGQSGLDVKAQTGIESLHLGYIEDDSLKARAYGAADVFVTPTRAETFGLTALESIACGTPAVSSDVGPMPEIVRDGQTGFAVSVEDAAAYARAIERTLTDGPLCGRMREACRAVAVAEYGVDRMVDRYLDVYRRAASPAMAA